MIRAQSWRASASERALQGRERASNRARDDTRARKVVGEKFSERCQKVVDDKFAQLYICLSKGGGCAMAKKAKKTTKKAAKKSTKKKK